MESIIGGQRSRESKIETGVIPTEWVPDAWDKDMKYQHSSVGLSLTFGFPSLREHPKCQRFEHC